MILKELKAYSEEEFNYESVVHQLNYYLETMGWTDEAVLTIDFVRTTHEDHSYLLTANVVIKT